MKKFKCKYCGGETEVKTFVPFRNTARQWVSDPEWKFHVRSTCFDCHKFNSFLKQTDELMESLKGATFMNLDLTERNLPIDI